MTEWAEILTWFLVIFAADVAASTLHHILFERKRLRRAPRPLAYKLLKRLLKPR